MNKRKVVDYAAVQSNPEMCERQKESGGREKVCVCVCAAAAQTHLPSGLNSKLLPKQEPVPDTQKGIDVATINFL